MKDRKNRVALSMVSRIAAILGILAIYVTRAGAAQRHVYPGESIQAAIKLAENGDEIIIHQGTYWERIHFGGKAITVRGENPVDPSVVAATVIDGGRAGSVVTFTSGESGNSLLSGVTIRNGLAVCGGGIYCQGSSPSITYCTIRENLAAGAGGCGSGGGDHGGGIYCLISSPAIINCTVRSNLAEGSGGGIYCLGSSPIIENSSIDDNFANGLSGGGGLTCENDQWSGAESRPVITNSILLGNSPDDLKALGGALAIASSRVGRYSGIYQDYRLYQGASSMDSVMSGSMNSTMNGTVRGIFATNAVDGMSTVNAESNNSAQDQAYRVRARAGDPSGAADETSADAPAANSDALEGAASGDPSSGALAHSGDPSSGQESATTADAACSADLTGDGQITPADALYAFRCYLGYGPCPGCADVNRDGMFSPADALCLFQKFLGQPSCLSGSQGEEPFGTIEPGVVDSYMAVLPKLFYTGEKGAVSLTLLGGDNLVRARVQATLTSKDGANVLDAEQVISGKGRIELTVPREVEQGEYKLTISGEGFSDSATVKVEEGLLLFVETDKPIYKPGQTIHLRLITLNSELRPVSRKSSVEVQDAKGIKIFRKEVDTDEYGLAKLDLPISTEPNLGVWKITAAAGQKNTQMDVRVEKYVLPKYEVQADMPKEWFLAGETIRGKIKAEYSFGKPVKGELVIVASRYVGTWEIYETLTKDIDGEADFEISPARYVAGVPSAGGMGNVTLDIRVKEKSTGYEEKVNKLLTVSSTPLNIQIIPESSVYKPSLPFHTLILTETPDQKPIDTRVGVTITYFDVEFKEAGRETQNIETKAGKAILTITPPAGRIAMNIAVTAENGSASKDIQAGYSPTGNFIHLEQLSEGRPRVGESMRFKIHSTANSLNFYYEVVARQRVVFTGLTQNSEISLTATPMMAPSAKLLVYQILPSSEVAADYLPFDVEAEYPHNVTASFSQEEVKPGEEIEIDVQTEGKARVGLAVVDKSVFILAENRLNLQQVFDELEKLYMTPQAELHDFSFQSSSRVSIKGAEDTFNDAGVIVLSNKAIPKGIEYQRKPSWRMWFQDGFRGGIVPLMAFSAVADSESKGYNVTSTPGGGDGLAEVERVRQFFPETWLWEDIITDSQGRASLKAQAPDSITTWMLHSVALSPDRGFGISDDSVRVFQSFFITIDLPYSAIRGEEFPVMVSIYNYLNEKQRVTVEIEPNEWFDLLDQTQKTIEIKANDLGGAQFKIRPKLLGTKQIKITARSSAAADAAIKTMIIEPEGVAREIVENVILSAGGSKVCNTAIATPVVEGSGRAYLCATSNYLTQTIDGLDALLKMPCGCGEQNMILLAPDIYITQYLKQSGQIKPEIMAKAEKLMVTGYQRELTYQRNDGSFSAFGQSDNEGSLWLTAFVLKVFSEGKDLIYIDDSVLQSAKSWIIAHQNSDGSFDSIGFIHHQDMMGGLQGKAALTAYIAIALLRAQDASSAARAIGYLETQYEDRLSEITDSYTMAILCYAFELAKSRMKDAAYARLMELAKEDEQGIFWNSRGASEITDQDGSVRATKAAGPASAQVETSAYALLALIEHGDKVNAGRAAKWLVSRRNSSGGFSSTQDTVVALEALTAYSKGVQADVDLTIEIETRPGTSSSTRKEIKIGSENFDVLQSIEVAINEEIAISAAGRGDAVIQVVTRFNLPQPPKMNETFKISVDYDTNQVEVNDLVKVSVEVEFNPPSIILFENMPETDLKAPQNDSSIASSAIIPIEPPITIMPPIRPPILEAGMVVLDISIPTGFSAVAESLEELIKAQKKMKRYEIAGRKVILFIENMLAGEKLAFSFDALALYPVKAKATSSQAYSYYQPEMKGETMSQEIVVLEH
ncbi:MAG: alpha-2-macroglobulin family protein [bacterium]